MNSASNVTVIFTPSGSSRAVYTVNEHDERRTDARPIDNSITEATPEQAYRIFQRHLTSESLRTAFLQMTQTENTHYFPSDAMKAREELQEALVIALPLPGEEQTVLTWQGENNAQIAQWANDYVDRAMQLARDELLQTLSSEVFLRQHSTQMQSDAVRKIGRVEREHQKERLRAALHIARSIGLEDMAEGPRLIALYSDDVMYLQGSRALEAQLQILEKREIDDPFLPQLVPLRQAQLLLDRMTRVPASLSVATIDDPARVAPIPIQPNRGLIISLGAILRLMLGVFVVLIQGTCQRHGATGG